MDLGIAHLEKTIETMPHTHQKMSYNEICLIHTTSIHTFSPLQQKNKEIEANQGTLLSRPQSLARTASADETETSPAGSISA
jgi:hypothetical protein